MILEQTGEKGSNTEIPIPFLDSVSNKYPPPMRLHNRYILPTDSPGPDGAGGLEDQPGAGRRETCPRRRGPAPLNTGPGGPAPSGASQDRERKDKTPAEGPKLRPQKKDKDGGGL